MANEKNITIELDMNLPEGYTLFADRTRIKQVLINLSSNAIKFTPNDKKIGFRVFQEGENTIIKCWDLGIGIPKFEMNRVFEPFEQIRNDFTAKTKGSGLGLSIVKSILDLHGYSIELESEEFRGSTFTITIPPKQSLSLKS